MKWNEVFCVLRGRVSQASSGTGGPTRGAPREGGSEWHRGPQQFSGARNDFHRLFEDSAIDSQRSPGAATEGVTT